MSALNQRGPFGRGRFNRCRKGSNLSPDSAPGFGSMGQGRKGACMRHELSQDDGGSSSAPFGESALERLTHRLDAIEKKMDQWNQDHSSVDLKSESG